MIEQLSVLPDIYKGIFTGVIGAFITGIAVYLNEKSKRRALLNDNKRLVKETESIKADYNRELEELKRDHQLEISRRKHQYEGKKDSYVAFFKMIDTFSADQNIKSQEKLRDYIHEFNRNFGDTQSSQKKATLVFSKKIQAITMESYKEFIRLKQETSVIKLMASEDVVNHLQLMELGYENLMKESDKMMSAMPVLVMSQNEEKMKAMKDEIEIKGRVINQIKDELNGLMRKELNEI
ncbi:hypothetical protein [Chryseobacterium jejuense]|uniref:hypothetical protein n=1 Tax=Chryseobacterium jejuense TaxID=445960 RepID=UPI001AE983A0|nr:hypothetical protein [Chryseobacterium jejuense]MBP2619202.1 hypothetical protein [Chryseobacterium jejuense]